MAWSVALERVQDLLGAELVGLPRIGSDEDGVAGMRAEHAIGYRVPLVVVFDAVEPDLLHRRHVRIGDAIGFNQPETLGRILISEEEYFYQTKLAYLKNTDEFHYYFKEFTEYYKDSNVNVIVTFSNSTDWIVNKLKRLTLSKRSNVVKPKKVLTEYFVLNIEYYGYFAKKTKYGFRYSYYLNNMVRKFATEKQALKYKEKISSVKYNIMVEKIK